MTTFFRGGGDKGGSRTLVVAFYGWAMSSIDDEVHDKNVLDLVLDIGLSSK